MTERLETHSVESEADEMDQRDETLASLGEANDQLMAKNHALAKALSRATQELTKAKAQLNQLAGPPMTFATMVRVHSSRTDEQGVRHASAEVISGSRRMIVPVAANVQASRLEAGRTVLLNENMVVVSQAGTDAVGRSLMMGDCWSRMAVETLRWSAVRERCRKLRSMCPTVLRSIRP